MRRLTDNKIVLITRQTRLDELVARFNTVAQARFYVERLGADFSDYEAEDALCKAAAGDAARALDSIGRVQRLDRRYLPSFVFGKTDTVVVLGQDGLVANVLKYLHGQPVIGINPDPARWEGILVPFTTRQLGSVVRQLFERRRPLARVTMAEAVLNTGETLLAVNDLFIGPRSHTSARYNIRQGADSEAQSSSGIIVSTGLGSTGWLRSIIAGAHGIAGVPPIETRAAWDSPTLRYSVREPWPSKTTAATMVHGQITASTPLVIESQMPESGVIFSDGIEADFVRFNAGTTATVRLASQSGVLVR